MGDSKAIRVVIADDHAMLREGLNRLLEAESGFQVVGQAGDGNGAVQLCADLQPDVLLLDVAMPGCDGLTALKRLMSEAPSVHSILLTAGLEQSALVAALQLGARGVLYKEAASTMLFESIRSVARNEYWLRGEVVRQMIDAIRIAAPPVADAAEKNRRFGLTARELEVIAGVAAGETNKEIAERLTVREDTVKHHLSNIFDKVGVFSRLELAVFAINHALVAEVADA
jgi:two-component system, NarL family, nitrate/nitrite response regulator NarL